MSVASTDIIIYGSANMQETDSGTQGGSIDVTTRVIFDSATLANDPGPGVVSVSGFGLMDTGNMTVYGRNAAGSLISEVIAISGVQQNGSTSFERILKCVITDGAPTGTVRIVNQNTTLLDMETTVLTVRRPFYDVSADVSGGDSRDYYEKVFIKNNHATNALLSARIQETEHTGDPSNVVTFDIDTNVDGSTTSTNRRTAPAASGMQGSPTFDSDPDDLDSDTDLGAGEAIGVWMELTLSAGLAAAKTTYSLTASGSTI